MVKAIDCSASSRGVFGEGEGYTKAVDRMATAHLGCRLCETCKSAWWSHSQCRCSLRYSGYLAGKIGYW